MNRVPDDTILNGDFVSLVPLGEQHFAELAALAEEKEDLGVCPLRYESIRNSALLRFHAH